MRDDIFSHAPQACAPAPDDSPLRARVSALWRGLVAWRGARRRARRDRDDLASMTERELRDIGVCLGEVPAAADAHWTRDWPR